MTSSVGSRPPGWRPRHPGRPCNPPPWSTRRTSAWSAAARFTTGSIFFRVAAEAMRRVLVDRARQKRRGKRGGGRRRVSLSEAEPAAEAASEELVELDEALGRLAAV